VEVLQAIAEAYREKKEEIEEQADNLTEHLKTTNTIGNNYEKYVFDKKNIELAYQNIMKTADKEWGGFGRAPKFPQTFTINFLLRYSILTGNKEALHQALLSLNKMIQGGIYDQLGGGFARYSTDTEWLAPHFEKMLYDNALLICTLSEGYQITKKERYKEIIEETLTFVERELMHKQGGFYSALDADSEGEEGKFYVWEYQEIEKLLGKNAFIFSQYYNVRREGNWEGKNILHTTAPLKEFSGNENIDFEDLKRIIDEGKTVLLKERNKRIRPGLDDKLLLSWNALMNSAYSKAYAATGNEHYKEVAIKNMNFLLSAFSSGKNQLFHSWKNEQGRHQAFLEDYSFLIAALIDLSEISTDTQWLEKAKGLTIYVTENFSDNETALLFYTQISQTDILLRKKEVYDSAIPSGNSVMALNFYRMGIIYDNEEWRQRATQMVSSFANMAVKYPTSFGVWLSMVFQISFGTNEIAIVGSEFQPYLNEVLKLYIPHSIIMASGTENNFPLLKGKSSNFHTSIYLCRNYACQQPLNSVKEFENMVSSNFFPKYTIFE
jgi:uncharacterized protein YyaL (SSP411 family)